MGPGELEFEWPCMWPRLLLAVCACVRFYARRGLRELEEAALGLELDLLVRWLHIVLSKRGPAVDQSCPVAQPELVAAMTRMPRPRGDWRGLEPVRDFLGQLAAEWDAGLATRLAVRDAERLVPLLDFGVHLRDELGDVKLKHVLALHSWTDDPAIMAEITHLKNRGVHFEHTHVCARSGPVLARDRQAAGNHTGVHAQNVPRGS